MTGQQAALEQVKGMDNLSLDEKNVELVRIEGVRVISGVTPRSVRSALNAAVKVGYLGRLKKEGIKSECYFHPNSRSRAIELRNQEVRDFAKVAIKICC